MKKIISIITICFFSNFSGLFAQGLPLDACAVRFTYDATGNLIQRDFFCNITDPVVYRTTGTEKGQSNDSINVNSSIDTKEQLVRVNAIAPNPTTGQFTITLSSPLNQEKVTLTDLNGRAIEKKTISGAIVTFDISNQPAGVYFVRIENKGKVFTFKVIKQ